jgi:hypothetical protein
MFVEAMLGLVEREGEIRLDPCVPDEIGRIFVSRLRAFGTHWDVEAIGREGHVRLAIDSKSREPDSTRKAC